MNSFLQLEPFRRDFDSSDYKEKLYRNRTTWSNKNRSVSVNDREEIRRRLAMDSDGEEQLRSHSRKTNFTKRIQNGASLQICFMNESPTEFNNQDNRSDHHNETNLDNKQLENDSSPNNNSCNEINNLSNTTVLKATAIMNNTSEMNLCSKIRKLNLNPTTTTAAAAATNCNHKRRPTSLHLKTKNSKRIERFISLSSIPKPNERKQFHTYHIQLHSEARLALSQAKEMAKMQMLIEKREQKQSPIANMLKIPYSKGNYYFHNISISFLHELNITQLQLLLNDLHSQIEYLNEQLVEHLMNRDELHMEQDSILVDIEDLTLFL